MTPVDAELMDRTDIEGRIERVYRELHPDASSSHGAKAWFARRAHIRPSSLSRYFGGPEPREPMGPVLGVLEQLEARAAERAAHKGLALHL